MTIYRKKQEGGGKLIAGKYISELIDVLRHEIRSFNILVELLILEEKGLVECDNDLLIKVLEKQEDVFSSIACLEKSRADIIARIAESICIEPEMLTISEIAEYADVQQKEKLVETAHILAQIHGDINNKKTTNSLLIKQGIMLVESNIRLILKAVGKEDMLKEIYSSNAETQQISGSMHIDGRL